MMINGGAIVLIAKLTIMFFVILKMQEQSGVFEDSIIFLFPLDNL